MTSSSAASFVWPDRPYPDASARVDQMMAGFKTRCLIMHARQVAAQNPRFGPRLSNLERAYIGRCNEISTVLAERYGISAKHVGYLRRKARMEDGTR